MASCIVPPGQAPCVGVPQPRQASLRSAPPAVAPLIRWPLHWVPPVELRLPGYYYGEGEVPGRAADPGSPVSARVGAAASPFAPAWASARRGLLADTPPGAASGVPTPPRADAESASPPRAESPPPPPPPPRPPARAATGGGALRRSKTRHCVSENRLDAAGRLPPETGFESVSAVRYGGPALGAIPATPPTPAVADAAGLVSPSAARAQPSPPLPSPPPALAPRLEAAGAPPQRRDVPCRAAERSRFAPKAPPGDAGDSPRSPLPAAPHPGGALALVEARAAAASLAASFHARAAAAARGGGASSSCSSLASTDGGCSSEAADTSPPHSLPLPAAALLARPSLAGGVLRPRGRSSSSGSLAGGGSASRLSSLGGGAGGPASSDGRDSAAALLPPPRPPLASPSPPPYDDAPPPPPPYEAPPWLPADPAPLFAAAEHGFDREPRTPQRRVARPPADSAAPADVPSPPSPASPYAALGYLTTPGGRRAEPPTPVRYAAPPLPFPLRRQRASRLCSVLPGACPVVRPLDDAAAAAEGSASAYVASLLGSLAAAAHALVSDTPQLPPTPPELERNAMARRMAERAEGAAAY